MKRVERAAGGDARVELAHASRRRSCAGWRRAAGPRPARSSLIFSKRGPRQVDLAAHLEARAARSAAQRRAARCGWCAGSGVMSSPRDAVAARRADASAAVLVDAATTARPSIFGSSTKPRIVAPEQCGWRASCQARSVVGAEGVGQAEQRHAVLDDAEALRRRRADALGGRVGRDQLGMLGLDRAAAPASARRTRRRRPRARRARSSGSCGSRSGARSSSTRSCMLSVSCILAPRRIRPGHALVSGKV